MSHQESTFTNTMRGSTTCIVLLVLLSHCICAQTQRKRIWTVGIGDDWGAHEYRDAAGYLQGFGPEFVDAVCMEGAMDCRLVWAPYTFCWVSGKGHHPYGGDGLHQRWFDACSSWVPTIDRVRTFTFTLSYMKQVNSYLFTAKGKSIDPNDLAGKTIGFLEGWASNEQCLARQNHITNNVLSKDQIVYKGRVADILEALTSGVIDAYLGTESTWTNAQLPLVQRHGQAVRCFLGGTALMARKDSEFVPKWNTAFSKLLTTRKFIKLCVDSNLRHSVHGSEVDCIGL